jgi:hypothetical protein
MKVLAFAAPLGALIAGRLPRRRRRRIPSAA